MDDRRTDLLRSLLSEQLVGALGTLHRGKPAVSMTPFAVSPVSKSLVIHVSRLATHTQDMETGPSVAFLVVADRDASVAPQARARLSIAGRATRCAPGHAEYEAAHSAYLARFPESEPMFGFGDFSLFLIEPESVRVVGGFAQAWSLTRERFLQAMADAE